MYNVSINVTSSVAIVHQYVQLHLPFCGLLFKKLILWLCTQGWLDKQFEIVPWLKLNIIGSYMNNSTRRLCLSESESVIYRDVDIESRFFLFPYFYNDKIIS